MRPFPTQRLSDDRDDPYTAKLHFNATVNNAWKKGRGKSPKNRPENSCLCVVAILVAEELP